MSQHEQAFTNKGKTATLAEHNIAAAMAAELAVGATAASQASDLSMWVKLNVALTTLINAGPNRAPSAWGSAIVAPVLPLLEQHDNPFSLLSRRLATLIYGCSAAASMAEEIDHATARLKSHLTANQAILRQIEAFVKEGVGREELIAYYQTTLAIDRKNIEELSSSAHRDVLLAHYVQSAGGYLSVLAAYVPIADALELHGAQASGSRQSVIEQLESDIGGLTDRAMDVYQYGLSVMIKRNQDDCASERLNWSDYHAVNNDITLTALDIVTLWPYLNAGKYATATAIRNKHRRLTMIWYTDRESGANSRFRGDITQLEAEFNKPVALRLLRHIKFSSATYAVSEHSDASLFSGLRQVQCITRSTDGAEVNILGPVTGPELPTQEGVVVAKHSLSVDLNAVVFLAAADFWRGDSSIDWNGSSRMPSQVITNFMWLTKPRSGADAYCRERLIFSPVQEQQMPQAVNTFCGSVPSWQEEMATFHPSWFTQQLADFQVLDDPRFSAHNYFLTWLDESMRADMLPARGHVPDGDLCNPIEQFHAIRALASIQMQALEVVRGPGFTGGDLVAMGAGSNISFILKNDKNRAAWFAGFYKVRLWFVQPQDNVDVSVQVTPVSGLPSITSAVIAATATPPDLAHLKFSDLVSFEFPATVLIVESFEQITLRVENHSLDASLVLDRIELIFDSGAT